MSTQEEKPIGSALKQVILECLCVLKPQLSESEWRKFIAAPENELFHYHFGLGLYLRNQVLIPGSEVHRLFVADGVCHKDDMSSLMLRLWHKELTNGFSP